MLRAVRILLQALIFLVLVSVVIAIGSATTGAVEKVALAGVGAVLVWLAARVRRLERRRPLAR